jgi:hypothetical protein
MGGIAFPFNEYLDITFFIGVPFGIAWLMERFLSVRARWGFVAGAVLAVPVSWWLFNTGPERISNGNFYGYLQALVNCLDVWTARTAQDVERTWRQIWGMVVTVPVCGAIGAWVAAQMWPRKEVAVVV